MRFLLCVLLLISFRSFAQSDTIQHLEEVTVRAFEQTHKYKDVPASIAYINRNHLSRFNSVSVLQAVNTIPGVRMEERSPGSFRFNIRGSSLRSPFGVRNVKLYYNDIPFTDPGGQTYLNQLGAYNFNSIEILKGPSGSLYGAGTGGTILIDGFSNDNSSAFAEYTVSSYNSHNVFGRISIGNERSSQFSFQHQTSDGYREHSALRRNVFTYNGNYQLNTKTLLRSSFLYGDLEYQTPGALTLNEYNTNAKNSRPAAGAFPGAVTAQAAIMQKMFLAGLSLTQNFSDRFQNKTVLYGMFSELKNPAIQNYGHNTEPHAGLRTIFSIKESAFNIQFGGEWQRGFAVVDVYKNVSGNADSLRTSDKINTSNAFAFAQITYENSAWLLTAASSINSLKINFQRFSPATTGVQTHTFSNTIAPRFAVLKKWKPFNVYASIAKGFSPPTTAEIFPSGNAINTDLQAETGVNYEFGLKGNIVKNLFLNINAFHFNLNNAIAQRRTAGGGDFYINAGKTKQRGVETLIQYQHAGKENEDRMMFWFSHAYSRYRYVDFKQLTNDYSGNQLPSIPKHTFTLGADVSFKKHFNFTANYFGSGKIALNDANSVYADDYHLIGAKFSYLFSSKNIFTKLSFGADNLLDEKYSLGNDINGFNGRYYNVAPGRNYYASVSVQLNK